MRSQPVSAENAEAVEGLHSLDGITVLKVASVSFDDELTDRFLQCFRGSGGEQGDVFILGGLETFDRLRGLPVSYQAGESSNAAGFIKALAFLELDDAVCQGGSFFSCG